MPMEAQSHCERPGGDRITSTFKTARRLFGDDVEGFDGVRKGVRGGKSAGEINQVGRGKSVDEARNRRDGPGTNDATSTTETGRGQMVRKSDDEGQGVGGGKSVIEAENQRERPATDEDSPKIDGVQVDTFLYLFCYLGFSFPLPF